MEEFANNHVSEIAIQCSAQSSKTQTIMALACWAIAEDPGPGMWVMAAKDEAKQFVRDRLGPTFESCGPVAESLLASESSEFQFTTMPFYVVGAGSPSKLQSKPIRWLFLDEVRNYPPGALDTVLKRTRAFWNARTVIISTPDREGDAVDRAFKAGDQRVFHITCPKCAALQPLVWEQLKWDTNETTRPAGQWDFDRLTASIRYECKACGHAIRDTPAERQALARGGRYVAMNPHAPRHRVSFKWNALLPWWVRWRSLVEEFLRARAAAKSGDVSPMKTFVNESLGEPWRDELGEIEDFEFLLERRGEYRFGETWPDELCRFMGVDRQAKGGEHYYYVVRAFGPGGQTRLVTYGRCNSQIELEAIAQHQNVPASNCLIDSGFKASDVYRFCRKTGWKPTKGDAADFFLRRDPRTNKTFRSLWDKTRVDPAAGTAMAGRGKLLPLYRFSSNGMKDLLFEYLTGTFPGWSVPRDVGRDYLKQLSAEHRVEERDIRGHVRYRWHQRHEDNHYLDCELQVIMVGLVTKLASAAGHEVSVEGTGPRP